MSKKLFPQTLVLHLSPYERTIMRRIIAENDPIQAVRARALLRVANGENRTRIAREAGVTREAMYLWINQYERRRSQGVPIRKAIAAHAARVVGGSGPILRLLLQANKAAKDWTIEEIKSFYRQRGIEISTGTAWNYKQALKGRGEPYPPPASRNGISLAVEARQRGLPIPTIYARIRNGWSRDRALSTPIRPLRRSQ